jgi:hypothetical protein
MSRASDTAPFGLGQHMGGAGGQGSACIGQSEAARRAVEQGCLQLLFQARHRL